MDKNAKPSKSETAYTEIRRIITEFILMPGQHICIKQLSDVLNFSTTPLREALFGLEKDGYVAKSRKDSFYVPHIDEDYIRNLFEFGKILYINASVDCYQHESHRQDNRAKILCNNHATVLNIDRLYKNAQEKSKNYFVSRQISVFRIKSKSIRTALLYSNEEIFFRLYGKSDAIDLSKFNNDDFFEEIHFIKNKLARDIAQSVLSYAIRKGLDCKNNYGESPIKDSTE